MVSFPNVVGLVFYGLLLSTGLSGVAETESFDRRQDGHGAGEPPLHQMQSAQSALRETIQGEVLRVEGNDWVIKNQDSKELRLQIDITTLMVRNIEPSDRIEAKVNDHNDVPAVTDRRNDTE